jgi:polyhydroxyalkanoate synthesis regulator phasin
MSESDRMVRLQFRHHESNQVIIFAERTASFYMNNPLVHAFFIGRAIAEAVSEQVEMGVTNALSELGKFDAEQRERLRQFTDEVMVRAQRAEEMSMQGRSAAGSSSPTTGAGGTDLQATIDDLRAETAQLRAELQRYRSSL